jgi:hypothetical protein
MSPLVLGGDGRRFSPAAASGPAHIQPLARQPVRPLKAERAIRRADDPVAVFVHGPVMTTTEQHEIAQNGRPALCPVAHVVSLPDSYLASREATRSVPILQGASQRGRDRPGAGSDLEQSALLVVPHHHAARVAGQAPRRLRGNVAHFFQRRLAGLGWIGEGSSIHVQHHLVSLEGGILRGLQIDKRAPRRNVSTGN